MSERDRTDQLIEQQDRDEAEYLSRARINKDIPQSVDTSGHNRRVIFDRSFDDPILYAVVAKHVLRNDDPADRWEEAMREAVVHLTRQKKELEKRLIDHLNSLPPDKFPPES